MKGTSQMVSPPSKPIACAMRRAALRPRTGWRASQRSKKTLKTQFQVTAMAELPIARPLAVGRSCRPASRARVTTAIASAS